MGVLGFCCLRIFKIDTASCNGSFFRSVVLARSRAKRMPFSGTFPRMFRMQRIDLLEKRAAYMVCLIVPFQNLASLQVRAILLQILPCFLGWRTTDGLDNHSATSLICVSGAIKFRYAQQYSVVSSITQKT